MKLFFLIITAIITIAATAKDNTPKAIEANFQKERIKFEKFLQSLELNEIVNGWKVKVLEKEGVGAFNNYHVTFKGSLKTKVKYFHYVSPGYEIGGTVEDMIIFYFSDKDKKALPYHINIARISDKNFSTKIADNSYGTMEVLIDEVFLVLADNDVESNFVNVSKVINFKEEGRLNYGKNGEFADKADKELDDFKKRKIK